MKLLLEESERFSCSGCGHCCRATWEIPVEPSLAQRLANSPPVLRIIGQDLRPFETKPSGLPSVGRRADGACVFLRDDQLCQLHGEFGAKEKPLACQAFPFVVVPTPQGEVVELSYFCPAARRGEGALLGEQSEPLERLVSEVAQIPPYHPPFRVWKRVTTGWSGYLLWEEALLERLNLPLEPAEVLKQVAAALHLNHQDWGRLPLESFLEGAKLRWDSAKFSDLAVELGRRARESSRTQPLGDPSDSPSMLSRYLRSLIRRKTLLKSDSLLEGVALLALVPEAALSHPDGLEAGVQTLEELLTHGPGVPQLVNSLLQ